MKNIKSSFFNCLLLTILTASFVAILFNLNGFSTAAFAFSGDYALDFDGTNDYVQLDTAFNIIGSNWQSTKTISVWVRPTGVAPFVTAVPNVVFGNMIVGDHPRWFGIYQANVTSTNEDRIWVWNGDNTDTVGDAFIGIPYTIGEWVHITLVHHNNVITAYKNGVEIDSAPSGRTAYEHTSANNINLRIGGRETGQRFLGQIDEVRIWDIERTTNDIRQDIYRSLIGSESGLVAYYQMSDGTGTTLSDDSLNSWAGTLQGAPAWITSGAFAGPRNALDFDGNNDYVSIPADISMPANLTLETWVYPRDISSGQKWIAGEVNGAQLTLDGTQAQFRIHNGTSLQGPATATLVANEWQHVAGTYDGTNLRIFVNGIEGTSVGSSGSNVDQGGIFAIGSPDGTTLLNNIILDEVRLWGQANDRAQIRTGMFQSLQGNESGLTAYYRFDQDAAIGGSTTLYDLTNNGNHGTLTNMDPTTDWIASTPFNTWIGSTSNSWTAGENWSRYAVPSATDKAGIFAYLGSNAPEISSAISIGDMTIATSGSLTVNSSGSLSVAEDLFNHGTLTQIQDVDGSGSVSFFNTGNYGGLTIDPESQDLSATTVTIRGNQDCTTTINETVERCFDISSTTSPLTSTTLTFYFDSSELSGNSCITLDAFHWDGVNWNGLTRNSGYGTDGRLCGSDPQSIQVTGVTGFSPFVLKENSPNAITMKNFSSNSRSLSLIPVLGLLLLVVITFDVVVRKIIKR